MLLDETPNLKNFQGLNNFSTNLHDSSQMIVRSIRQTEPIEKLQRLQGRERFLGKGFHGL